MTEGTLTVVNFRVPVTEPSAGIVVLLKVDNAVLVPLMVKPVKVVPTPASSCSVMVVLQRLPWASAACWYTGFGLADITTAEAVAGWLFQTLRNLATSTEP